MYYSSRSKGAMALAHLVVLAMALIAFPTSAANYTACGMTSPLYFHTWVGSLVTESPLFYPKTEKELRQLVVQAAKYPNCKVRVAGTGGSTNGIVALKQDKNVIVVNLNELETNQKWNGILDTTANRVRMGAGKTFLDLMALVRPRGYVLHTRSLGKYFTLGGMYMNPGTHGATLGAERIAKYATGFRVLLSNGKYSDITDPAEVAVWRGSMGLLGIVVAVEIEVQRDLGMLQLYSNKTFATNFTAAAIIPFLKQSMLGMDAVHWFYNFWNDKIFALTVRNNADPTFNYTKTAGYYMAQQMQFPNLGKAGVSPLDPKALGGAFNGTLQQLAGMISTMAEGLLHDTWMAGDVLARDGYQHETGQILQFNNVQTYVKCPVNCVDDGTIYQLLAGTRQIIQASLGFMNQLKPWLPTLLFNFRLVTVQAGGMLLDALEPGTYVSFEFEDAKGILPDAGHRAVFQRLERFWRSVQPNPKAHAGKEWGYDKLASLDDPYAFQDVAFINSLFSPAVKKQFIQKMHKYDPRGLFRAGAALVQLGVNNKMFDPRSNLGEQCDSTGLCLDGCCCTFWPTCNAAGMLNKCVPCSSSFL